MADRPQEISTEDARSGETPHVVRYVLLVSLLLAVAAMAFLFYAAPEPPPKAASATEAAG